MAKRQRTSTQKAFTAEAGQPYGWHPGNPYHDVEGTLTRTRYGWRCEFVETWGSNQGRKEEHGRTEASGRADTPHAAVEEAKQEALAINMERAYVATVCRHLLRHLEDADD